MSARSNPPGWRDDGTCPGWPTQKERDAHDGLWMLILLLLFVGCGNPPQPHPPRPQVCGLLGDSCDKTTPCCRAVNGAPIECFDGACEYK